MQCVLSQDWDEGTTSLTERLRRDLAAGKKVLWLLGGGSNIAASVKVMAAISEAESEKLAIFLTDERYGELGHPNSNARQLRDAGFQPKQAVFVPMLADGLSLSETIERYSQAMRAAFEHAEVIVAQFGIGPDGHIAGIVPGSPATSSSDWLAGYEAPPYTRVTMSFDTIRKVQVAFAMAFGPDKRTALAKLRDHDVGLNEQPAQILKELAEAHVYSDQF